MPAALKVVLLVLGAFVAVAAQRASITQEVVEERPAVSSVAGKIISVEPAAKDGNPLLREAIVKLSTGEKVRASVPPGCVVFAGQMTRLSQSGQGSARRYVVIENGRNAS